MEEARNKAMEKLSQTKRRKNDGSEVEPKKEAIWLGKRTVST